MLNVASILSKNRVYLNVLPPYETGTEFFPPLLSSRAIH